MPMLYLAMQLLFEEQLTFKLNSKWKLLQYVFIDPLLSWIYSRSFRSQLRQCNHRQEKLYVHLCLPLNNIFTNINNIYFEVLGCWVVNTPPLTFYIQIFHIFIQHTNLFCCLRMLVECWKIYKDKSHENSQEMSGSYFTPKSKKESFWIWICEMKPICKTMTVFWHYFHAYFHEFSTSSPFPISSSLL